MNMRFCFGILILLCVTTVDVSAGLISSGADLVDQIKPNLTTRSKPTTSPYPKYASVSFLQPETKLDFNGGEPDARTMCLSAGYGMQVSSCAKQGKNSSLLCPHDNTYTDACCDKEYNYTEDSSCSHNAVLSSSFCKRTSGESAVKYYKCECPVSAYPYQKESDCPNGYRIDYNPAKTCEANGEKRYASCMPKTYKDCSQEGIVNGAKGGLVGSGSQGFGMLADGTVVYEKCMCPSQFIYSDCDTFLIDESASCYNDGHYYYKAGNCYAGCSDNGSTDIDYYYKQSAMRCLFDDTGIISSTAPDKQYDNVVNINFGDKDKALCTRVIDGSEQVSKQTCAELGYVYSEDECPDKDNLILRCPSNDKKVWCMNANGCMNYPVSGEACNLGAKVSYCGSDQRRCIYDDSECNRNWNTGQHNGGYGGSTDKCCKDGWDYINGKCVEHDCGNVAYLYPYGDKYPIEEAAANGENSITMCKSGDKVYYGYAQCKGCGYGDTYTSNSCDDLWQPAADSPHRCVCKTDGLPYDNVTLYLNGSSGTLGVLKTCRDTDATYYGYEYCQRGYSPRNGTCPQWFICRGNAQAPYYWADTLVVDDGEKVSKKCTAEEEAKCAVNDNLCTRCTNETLSYVYNTYEDKNSVCYGYQCDESGKCCPKTKPYLVGMVDGQYYGTCYNICHIENGGCQEDDVVYYHDNLIGVVLKKNGSTVVIVSLENTAATMDWNKAMEYAANYAPSGLESDAFFGRGKWKLPSYDVLYRRGWISGGLTRIRGIIRKLAKETGRSYYYHENNQWSSLENKTPNSAIYDCAGAYINHTNMPTCEDKLMYKHTALPVVEYVE